MYTNTSLSIGVISKSRPFSLFTCLLALKKQQNSFPILVVDNNTNNTMSIVYQSICTYFDVLYFRERNVGYASARNKVLRVCKSDWLCFVDDDCKVLPNFGSVAKRIIQEKENTTTVAVNGGVVLLKSWSVYALCSALLNDLWKQRSSGVGWALDTKCCLLQMKFMRSNKLLFWEREQLSALGGEDVALGMQIFANGGKVVFNNKLLVFHREPETFLKYFQSIFKRSFSIGFLMSKTKIKLKRNSKKNVRIVPFLREKLKNKIVKQKFYRLLSLMIISVILYRLLSTMSYAYFVFKDKTSGLTKLLHSN